jgi:hypothetical protein
VAIEAVHELAMGQCDEQREHHASAIRDWLRQNNPTGKTSLNPPGKSVL